MALSFFFFVQYNLEECSEIFKSMKSKKRIGIMLRKGTNSQHGVLLFFIFY